MGNDGKHLVFVYGSLKRGLWNHSYLSGATFLGETRTLSREFRMESLGSFPAVYKVQRGGERYGIQGELYEVTNKVLEKLDILENNGRFYNRELVKLANGKEAWMYVCLYRWSLKNLKGVKKGGNNTLIWQPET